MTAELYHPNYILFTHKYQDILNAIIRASCLRMLFYAKWMLTSYQYNIC